MIGVLGFDSRQGLRIFLFITLSWPALGLHQPPRNVYRGLLPGGKASGAWSWPLTSIYCQGEECGAIPPLPQYICIAWYLFKHRDIFTSTFYLIHGSILGRGLEISLFITACRLALGLTSLLAMYTGGSFPGGKAAGTWRWPFTSVYYKGQVSVGL
jgi:hypothetical protein